MKLNRFINMTNDSYKKVSREKEHHIDELCLVAVRLPRSCKEKTEELWKAGEPLRNALRRLGMLMLTPL